MQPHTYFLFPKIDPVFFSIGPLSLRWYALAYLAGILFAFWQANCQLKQSNTIWNKQQIEDLLSFGFAAIVIGGRAGYVLFYDFAQFKADPLYLFRIWEGGMSFHGGLLGGIAALLLFSYKTKHAFLQVADFIVPLAPFGLGAGRLGNFINGELWGRVTLETPWAVIFPTAIHEDFLLADKNAQLYEIWLEYGGLPRHPSQLYEALLEGVLLFFILSQLQRRSMPTGFVSGAFLFFYGLFRFIVEFFRQPDHHLGLFHQFFSMGQLLCLPMLLAGFILMTSSYRFRLTSIKR